ncbi:hypothetical protein GCM10027347_55660 [Larkinella harenae]
MAENRLSRDTEPSRPFEEGEALSQLLISLLERRYLANFDSSKWDLGLRDEGNGLPVLRELLLAGKKDDPEEFTQLMAGFLSSCHQPGHALVTIQFSQEGQQKLFWGVKRMPGSAESSTEEHVLSLEGALQAVDNQVKLDNPVRLDHEKLQDLDNFLREAPSLALLTGIPSARHGKLGLHLRDLDRVALAIGSQRAAVVTVAEPVSSFQIDQTIDACLRLKSDVHGFVRVNRQVGSSSDKTKSLAEQQHETSHSFDDRLPGLLANTSLFIQALALLTPSSSVLGIAGLANNASNLLLRKNYSTQATSRQALASVREGESSGESRDLLNAHAESCEQLIDQYLHRLRRARSYGCWNTVTYLVADDQATLRKVSNVIRSLASGDDTHLDPLREIRVSTHLIRQAARSGQVLTLYPARDQVTHPFGSLYDTLGTCIGSDELTLLMHLPYQPLPGIQTRKMLQFALTASSVESRALRLGQAQQGLYKPLFELKIPLESLNTHAFISGKSGSGKTNTCMQILSEAYRNFKIPFMVIEPAKEEYRGLMQVDGLKEHLRVFAVGNPNAPALRINPFEPVPGITIARHIDLLKSVFNATFPMFGGMSYVLEDAIYEIYYERGWSLHHSSNRFLQEDATEEAYSALMPTLVDLLFKIEVVLQRKNYGREIHQNLSAALRSRIQSLLIGNKGLVFNTRRSIPFRELMDRPCIIEMQHLGNDDEKSFLAALMYVFIYEYAEVRQRLLAPSQKEKLQHILLIEEAHKLLTAKPQAASEEVGDPKGKAVAMFTDMLAELRAYGEGIIVADQTPTKLAREVIKNTNLKIVHRLTDPDERQAAGRSINLSDDQIHSLAVLPDGFAVVQDKNITDGLLVKVHPFKQQNLFSLTRRDENYYLHSAIPADKQYLHRHAGCLVCQEVCQHYQRVEESESLKRFKALEMVMLSIIRKDSYQKTFNVHWMSWLNNQKAAVPTAVGSHQRHYLFCLSIQQAESYLVDNLMVKKENSKRQQDGSLHATDSPRDASPILNIQPPLPPATRLVVENILGHLSSLFHSWLFETDDEKRQDALTLALSGLPALS